MLAFKASGFSRFRQPLFPMEDSTWAILDAAIALDAFFRINPEPQRIHFLSKGVLD
jgi:hypothetical protein